MSLISYPDFLNLSLQARYFLLRYLELFFHENKSRYRAEIQKIMGAGNNEFSECLKELSSSGILKKSTIPHGTRGRQSDLYDISDDVRSWIKSKADDFPLSHQEQALKYAFKYFDNSVKEIDGAKKAKTPKGTILLIYALCYFVSDNGYVSISKAALSHYTGLKESQVKGILKKLILTRSIFLVASGISNSLLFGRQPSSYWLASKDYELSKMTSPKTRISLILSAESSFTPFQLLIDKKRQVLNSMSKMEKQNLERPEVIQYVNSMGLYIASQMLNPIHSEQIPILKYLDVASSKQDKIEDQANALNSYFKGDENILKKIEYFQEHFKEELDDLAGSKKLSKEKNDKDDRPNPSRSTKIDNFNFLFISHALMIAADMQHNIPDIKGKVILHITQDYLTPGNIFQIISVKSDQSSSSLDSTGDALNEDSTN